MTDPAMPSIDQVQAAITATKAVLSAAKTFWDDWSPIVAWVAVVAHAIPWFSQPDPNSRWAPVRKVLDLLAGNYGSATNAKKG